jgi:hypothetical protein
VGEASPHARHGACASASFSVTASSPNNPANRCRHQCKNSKNDQYWAAAWRWHYPRNKEATETWAHRLIEAQRDPSSGQAAFLEHAEVWLECCREHVAFFRKNWRSLALLTRYLPQHHEIQAACPTFHSHVLVPALHVSGDMEMSLSGSLCRFATRTKRCIPCAARFACRPSSWR